MDIAEIFGFVTPVAIYAWENEKCKNIPCIENFDVPYNKSPSTKNLN